MAAEEKPVQQFLEAVGKAASLWQAIDVRVLAIRIAGEWHNLLTRCYLVSNSIEKVLRLSDLPETEDVAFWQHVLPIGELQRIVKGVEGGQLQLGDAKIIYRAIRASPGQDRYSLGGYTFSDLSERFRASYRPWSCHQLTAMGNSVHEVIIEVPGRRFRLDNAVRTLEAPFDGLDGVARYAVGSPDPLEPNRVCLFEVFAPLEVQIRTEECRFERGILRYVLRAGSAAAAQGSRLNVFARGSVGVPHSTTVRLGKDAWKESNGYLEASGDIKLTGQRVATLFVSLGGYSVHRVTLFDVAVGGANPRLDVFQTLDPEFEVLRDSLAIQGSQGAAQFDGAVARLLGLAGFQVVRLSGDKRLEEAVDLVAHVPGASVCLAIECTTGPLNSKGKLGKLVARAEGIRRECSQLDVQAVIFTPLERAQVLQADLNTASDEEIAVLCREDIEELLTLVLAGDELSEVLSAVRGHIPRKPPTSPLLRRQF